MTSTYRYVLSYTNGHQDTYVISKTGQVTQNTTGKTSTLRPSDNKVEFPSSKGWYKSSGTTTWEYIRLKTDGSIVVHRFSTDGCRAKYKSLKNYCCRGVGTISVTGDALMKKVGTQKIV